MDAAWYDTADGRYYRYIKDSIDPFITADGAISTYEQQEYTLDNVLAGRQLLLLYRVTLDKRYYEAATELRRQIESQPRNASGGFWHKKIYPNQMWLDGLYMAEPFLAEYASVFHEPQDFAEITRQFVLIEQHTRDAKTGLLYHGWDESKQQGWANPTTGTSANFWARGMGWYMMALVDTLPYFPEGDPGREQLLAILQRTAAAIVRYQDAGSGLWYQVLDKGGEKGNYFESSAACMFTYALAKGVRLGYLRPEYESNAQRAWSGIQNHFLKTDADGALTLTGTVQAVGAGRQRASRRQLLVLCFRAGGEQRSQGRGSVSAGRNGDGACFRCGGRARQHRSARRVVQQPDAQKRRGADGAVPLQVGRLERFRLFALRPYFPHASAWRQRRWRRRRPRRN